MMKFMNSQPFKRQSHKMVKHTQTIRRLLPMNWLSVFEIFVGLVLKRLIITWKKDNPIPIPVQWIEEKTNKTCSK